ncbi:TonB-dependent receptor plug domain-containing protein [Paracoccus aminophilus]|uniref:TonB-dependent receptor n=1 Tax=Paracoccus aminophilus JCM 7686 TaxID=1367847 RepID=S5XVC0_PARAH|nr:TonB-dependent receptor [Paracoccus aminophilus]AGT11464.1 TonB-dependent receptor [Paracoccus aminophilus JCM 7686]
MVRLQTSWLAISAVLLPLAVMAQDVTQPVTPAVAQDDETAGRVTLETVVISGGLSPIPANAYGRAYTILTADEIERRGIRSVQDALRDVPGVAVSSTGSSFTQVRIRGAEANHTLILIDGVPATGGNDEYILSGLETANIDRIEILRGPQSVYYGANASAGVINIITRQGQPGTHYGGAVEAGNGYAVSGWFTQRTERGGLAFTASKRDDHGYNQAFTGHEKDGIDRATLGLTGDWQASDEVKLGFTLRRAKEKYDYDSTNYAATSYMDYLIDDPNQHSTRNETLGSIWGEYAMLDGRVLHRLDYQDTVYKQSSNGGPETRGQTRALKYRLSASLDGQQVAEARQLVNVMVERVKDDNTAAPDYRRANTSVALEYRGFFDNGLDVQAGLRHDRFTSFDDFTSWNLALSWQVPNAPYRVHASAGRGLVKPSYYELFANDSYTLGNPHLKPERNTGFDIGIEAELLGGRGTVDLTYFNEKMDDEITYAYGAAPDGSGRASYVNQHGKSPREGIELAGQLQATEALRLGLNYTYLDAKNPDGSVEIRRPRHEFGLRASYDLDGGRGNLSADLRHVAGNYDTQFWGSYPTRELPSYTVVNLAGGYDINQNLRATARVVNLFDKDYMDAWGYRSQGRTAYVGLEAKW